MNIQTEVVFDSGTQNLEFSLRRQKYVVINGTRHNVGEPERIAVTPLDMGAATSFVFEGNIPRGRNAAKHPILDTLQTLWTDDVVAAYAENHEAKYEAEEQ